MVRTLTLLAVVSLATGCSSPERERLRETTRPTYDDETGRLRELTSDANGDGIVDTWTEMDGPRPVRSRIDRDQDGTIDRWEYYDAEGRLLKVGFSRPGDGTPDAWAYAGPSGRVERVELSSARDEGRIDRWERYEPANAVGESGMLAAAEEDTTRDGRPDKWETYAAGVLQTAAFDENGDGRPDRRLTYDRGVLVLIEETPDTHGRFIRQVSLR